MASIKLRNFSGMHPRAGLRNVQNVPDMIAEQAVNTDLLSGNLKPHRRDEFVTQLDTAALGFVPRAVFRIPEERQGGFAPPGGFWLGFERQYTQFVQSLVTDDAAHRWYWIEGSDETNPPKPLTAATEEFLVTGADPNYATPEYRVGIPRPPVAPTVTPAGGTGPQETRCYVYCFVNEYGELGPPSDVDCATGNADGTWTITYDTTVPPPWDTEGAAITDIRIFRTVTSATGGSFFFVDEIPVATPSPYTDTTDSGVVAYNEQLESDTWTPPPDDLEGMVVHPNGFMAAYRGHELWFSWPYRHHAWPAEYVLTMETEIRGLGVYGNSIVVTTNAHPYTCTGIRPESMTLTKYRTTEPNLSRESVVSLPQGVMYASTNGLMLASDQKFTLITQPIMTYEEWQTRYKPEFMRGVRYGFQYLAWNSENLTDQFTSPGFIYAPDEQNSLFTELTTEDLGDNTQVYALHTDPYDGQPYLSLGDGSILRIFGLSTPPGEFLWRSKEFITPKPCNLGFYDVDFDDLEPYQEPVFDQRRWNEARIEHPLSEVGGFAVGDSDSVDLGLTAPKLPEIKQPTAGSPLWTAEELARLSRPYLYVRIYADRVLRHVRRLDKRGQYRSNSGFKAHIWQIELVGNCDLRYFDLAETGKELASV